MKATKKRYDVSVFHTSDNQSFAKTIYGSSFEDAVETELEFYKMDGLKGHHTHSNVIEWSDGTYTVYALCVD